ncbi:MAG: steroid 5-alpha reductase [Deltaproteobacteria bacterium HGW-Deltaproteobacteria-18]|jgi:steroid 5-alpha reductase family enzyme|nr:MAG: steroid 5-alpha reductase [Deltaproteobacteria bacterium HGW-Deltaproteobacteria-18]
MTVVLLGAAVALFLTMNTMFVIGTRAHDNSLIDIAYGPAFVLACLGGWLAGGMEMHFRPLLMFGLLCLWAVRLAVHIGVRHRGRGEDFRYRNFREQWGEAFVWRSFLQIYMLQGLVVFLVAMPVLMTMAKPGPGLVWTDLLGVFLFAVGFFFEAVGDWQLTRFKRSPAAKGRIMTTGLWRYTRHPNYFGEAVLWWGFFFLGLGSAYGWYGLVSPVLIGFLLLKVSGIPMLEEKYKGQPEFEAYKNATSAFFPWPPRSMKTRPSGDDSEFA